VIPESPLMAKIGYGTGNFVFLSRNWKYDIIKNQLTVPILHQLFSTFCHSPRISWSQNDSSHLSFNYLRVNVVYHKNDRMLVQIFYSMYEIRGVLPWLRIAAIRYYCASNWNMTCYGSTIVFPLQKFSYFVSNYVLCTVSLVYGVASSVMHNICCNMGISS
jgi:hypothetical protein